jgi:hypothetical protein
VTEAILGGDQQVATDEKAKLENAQRDSAKLRLEQKAEWKPKLFKQDESGIWVYKYLNNAKWNSEEEIETYELNGIIRSRTGDETSSPDEESEDEEKDSDSEPDTKGEIEEVEEDGLSPASSGRVLSSLEEWKTGIESRIFEIEKNMLSLHHKNTNVSPPKSSPSFFHKYRVVFLIVAIAYLWYIHSKISELSAKST